MDTETKSAIVGNLRKRYGRNEVLSDVSFTVNPGEIFSLIGQNGSGKTTIMEILEGIRKYDAGTVLIYGKKPGDRALRERIGIALQDSGAFGNLRISELVDLHRSFYRNPLKTGAALERVGLSRKGRYLIGTLSGGERQRLNLAVALVSDPDLLLLDEPSGGLDPAIRNELWEILSGLRDSGKTIILSTHDMDGAERLSDTTAILYGGKIIRSGSPGALVEGMTTGKRIDIDFRGSPSVLIPALSARFPCAVRNGTGVSLTVDDPESAVAMVMSLVRESGPGIKTLSLHAPTLEDLFLSLTGGAE